MCRVLIVPNEGLPVQPFSREVLSERYLKAGELGCDDIFRRVSKALASVEEKAAQQTYEALFLKNLRDGAIGAGRIMHAAGTALESTLINCFVQPVGDTVQSVHQARDEAGETLRRGGGVGYDFSCIYPRHAEATEAFALDPCGYIDMFDTACAALAGLGARRGAQMGVLRIDHPDIDAFMQAKRKPGRWTTFNVSVAVTDAFMHACVNDESWQLVHHAKPNKTVQAAGALQRGDGLWVYETLPAKVLWQRLTQSAYELSEPGVLFIDHIQRDNNLRALETIATTNPCGEQPLPPYGCCDLGPLILPRFVRHPFGLAGDATFDFDAFEASVALQVRALDNVLDLTRWPLPQQREEAMGKRRIGVGLTGLGNALTMLCLRYDSDAGRAMAARIAQTMRDAAYRASVSLAIEKGAFPQFSTHTYFSAGNFASRLPEALQRAIRAHGIRNSHLLSIAPAGSVSLAFADNASNGIEPSFAWQYLRKKRAADGSQTTHTVEDYAWRLFRSLGGNVRTLPSYFVSALDMTPASHIAMMQTMQPFVDAAISKTVNVPENCTYEVFEGLFLQAWQSKLKGFATYRPNDIVGSVLQVT